MNDQTLATVLGLLYTAANRNLGDAERVVWREAVGDVRDDVALKAARLLVREQNLWERPPTPAGFREVARGLSARRREVETDDRALPASDAVRSARGWRVERHCGRCTGSGWVEVEQEGSHIAVTQCHVCEGSGKGNELPPRVTPPDEARPLMAQLRKALAERPVVKEVP